MGVSPMSESTVVDLLLVPFLGLLTLEVYFWFWKTKESSFAPLTTFVAIPISTNEIGWPLGLRWAFPFAVFIAITSFSILTNRKGWRGIMARRNDHKQKT